MSIDGQIQLLEQKVRAMIDDEPGIFLVEIRIKPTNNVKVFLDADTGMSLDKLIHYNRKLYRDLEESVFFPGNDFSLEVSSPGLDRPLRTARDFARFAGQKARVKLRVPVDGQRNFVGVLCDADEGKVGLEVDGRVLSLDLGNVDKARLVPAL